MQKAPTQGAFLVVEIGVLPRFDFQFGLFCFVDLW